MKEDRRTTLRSSTLALRDQLSELERMTKSASACRHLLQLEQVQKAGVLFAYMHFRSEVQTTEFMQTCLKMNRVIAIPLTLPEASRIIAVSISDPEKDVRPGYCSIPEPVNTLVASKTIDPGSIDVVVVPGSVFDREGGRLGYGGGYYDRFLEKDAFRALRIGYAYEQQVVQKVPTEPHDQYMDYIVTEKNIYKCRGRYRA